MSRILVYFFLIVSPSINFKLVLWISFSRNLKEKNNIKYKHQNEQPHHQKNQSTRRDILAIHLSRWPSLLSSSNSSPRSTSSLVATTLNNLTMSYFAKRSHLFVLLHQSFDAGGLPSSFVSQLVQLLLQIRHLDKNIILIYAIHQQP